MIGKRNTMKYSPTISLKFIRSKLDKTTIVEFEYFLITIKYSIKQGTYIILKSGTYYEL